eukprot:49854_1
MVARGETSIKWKVLLWLTTLWIGSYHCILSVSALQYKMMNIFHLTDVQFSLYTSVVFGLGALISLFCPYIVGQINIYNTMTLSSVVVFAGQITFICGLYLFSSDHIRRVPSIIIQYIGRAMIGVGYGIQNATVYTTLNIWFQDSKWLQFAMSVISATFDLSIVTARYFILPLYRVTDDNLIAAYSLGLVLALCSIVGCLMMKRYENMYQKGTYLPIATQDTHTKATNALDVQLDSDLRNMQYFSGTTWLLIMYIVIGQSAIETYLTQFTLPLMIAFNITDEYANLLLSIPGIESLTLSLVWGWVMSRYGYVSYYLIGSMSFLFLSVIGVLIYGVSNSADGNYAVAWISMVCLSLGIEFFFLSAFASLFMVTPIQYSALANSMASFSFLMVCMAQGYLFGVLVINEGDIKNYDWSILMVSVSVVIGFVITVVVHIMDVVDDGPLHKGTNCKIECEYDEVYQIDVKL